MHDALQEKQPDNRAAQFSLQGVFALTTWAACTAALAAWRGPGVVVLCLGLAISALNAWGKFSRWQLPERRGLGLVRCAWLLLGMSLFLPAARGCSNQSIAGWQAAAACASAQIEMLDQRRDASWTAYVYCSTLNLGNLLLALSPWPVWRAQGGERAGRGYAAVLGVCAVGVWSLAIGDAASLLVGYYLWSLAALMLLSAFRLGPAAIAMMGSLSLLRLYFDLHF
ncbi:MAG TPA: hypothetical protein VHC19_01600 [Pirellulales bacterium]|nr:hypothetical protein [Pirellulales bacterium]